MEAVWKGKQTNKQTSRGGMCRGADAGGSAELHSMQSPICNASEYAEELQRCFRELGEGTEFNTQGHTLTVPKFKSISKLRSTSTQHTHYIYRNRVLRQLYKKLKHGKSQR